MAPRQNPTYHSSLLRTRQESSQPPTLHRRCYPWQPIGHPETETQSLTAAEEATPTQQPFCQTSICTEEEDNARLAKAEVIESDGEHKEMEKAEEDTEAELSMGCFKVNDLPH